MRLSSTNNLLSTSSRHIRFALLSALIGMPVVGQCQVETSIMAEFAWVDANYEQNWLNNWMEGGVGVLRFNENDDIVLSQLAGELTADLSSDFSLQLAGTVYTDGERKFGLTEAYVEYAPLSAGLKHEVKVGLFYPNLSLENVDIAWNSPYTYSFSAINSWVAEELKVMGGQWSITRRGRQYGSPHSFTGVLGVFKGNDVAGALLTWRGWALHNRQTRYGETIGFADYFQFGQFGMPLPAYEKVTEETDGQWGAYAGIHWSYLRSSDVRLYYYDNRANPLAIESNLQYAWDTQFWSLSAQHKVTQDFRLLGQWMVGQTQMGTPTAGVSADFDAWYLMASYHWQPHRLSLRYDGFRVDETDQTPADPNDSDGHSVTLAWRYIVSDAISLGVEWIGLTSHNENRQLWQGWAPDHTQHQVMAVIQWRL